MAALSTTSCGPLATSVPTTTSIAGVERSFHFEGEVLLPDNASNDQIARAIARQVKTALGALRAPQISLLDRDARANLMPDKWQRRQVRVGDRTMLQVRYKYDDRALVSLRLAATRSLALILLAGDYAPHTELLKKNCSDDPEDPTNSLWYHFQPTRRACAPLIRSEQQAIATERGQQTAPDMLGPREAARIFLPVTVTLGAPNPPATRAYPEYDRLFGLGSGEKRRLIVYVFLGVDKDDARNPADLLGREAVRFHHELLQAFPGLHVTGTQPFSMVLDFFLDGRKVEGVTYRRMLSWATEQRDFPAEADTPEKRKRLVEQVIEKLAERRITWEMPLQFADGKEMVLEVRSFFGREDGSHHIRERAQQRYREAFSQADVLVYSGHSHFGHGPLEPPAFRTEHFSNRYQIYFINSCISFNYYNRDFVELKPGTSRNLDMVVNGLPAYITGTGAASAHFLDALLAPTPQSYENILKAMRIDTPWATGYEPMRAVDGELDNTYAPARSPYRLIRTDSP